MPGLVAGPKNWSRQYPEKGVEARAKPTGTYSATAPSRRAHSGNVASRVAHSLTAGTSLFEVQIWHRGAVGEGGEVAIETARIAGQSAPDGDERCISESPTHYPGVSGEGVAKEANRSRSPAWRSLGCHSLVGDRPPQRD